MEISGDFHTQLSTKIIAVTQRLSKQFRQCSRVQWPHGKTRLATNPTSLGHSGFTQVRSANNRGKGKVQPLSTQCSGVAGWNPTPTQPPLDPKGKSKAPPLPTQTGVIRGRLGWRDPPSTVPQEAAPFLPYTPRIWRLPQAVHHPAQKSLPALLPAEPTFTVLSPSRGPEEIFPSGKSTDGSMVPGLEDIATLDVQTEAGTGCKDISMDANVNQTVLASEKDSESESYDDVSGLLVLGYPLISLFSSGKYRLEETTCQFQEKA